MAVGHENVSSSRVIGWLLKRWQSRYPGVVLAINLILLVAGAAVVTWWVVRDLSQGKLLRPVLAVLVLALVSMRMIVSFRPHRR